MSNCVNCKDFGCNCKKASKEVKVCSDYAKINRNIRKLDYIDEGYFETSKIYEGEVNDI